MRIAVAVPRLEQLGAQFRELRPKPGLGGR
jgi:hypothetical protein